LRIEPNPNPEEVAAIMAALTQIREERGDPEETASLRRSRWRLAGLLGHPPPRAMKLEGSLWSYSSWEGIV
jgi:Acyl-CoA carboxylase epsilon subunit